jgi:hypothetical protein
MKPQPDKRFTLDGSDALEAHLARICEQVRRSVQSLIPAKTLEAIVLGGGYGRGEGGVFKTAFGDQPYNDLEFYIFVRGNRLLATRKYQAGLEKIGGGLSRWAGLHLEFKIDSLSRLRRCPISMFTYDLVAGHRLIAGDPGLFDGCDHHLAADQIPLSEATRLFFNRCSGLLLAREKLRTRPLEEDPDFIGRNIAKARLALGDAVLSAFSQYHWSCRERYKRLLKLPQSPDFSPTDRPPGFDEIVTHHAYGIAFKLRPQSFTQTPSELEQEHQGVSSLALNLWLWLESRRLHQPFASPIEYSSREILKCPDSATWRNYLLNLRTFGVSALASPMALRYPRERLLNSLALLLWDQDESDEHGTVRHLQQQLLTNADDWPGLVAAYKRFWPSYG